MNANRIVVWMLSGAVLALGPMRVWAAAATDKPGHPDKDSKAPVEQELQMLNNARSEAAKASAALQAYICFQSATGYAQVDQKKATVELKRCFRQTLMLTDKSDAQLKPDLQYRILDRLLQFEPVATLELARSAEPQVRTSIESRRAEKLVSDGKFDEAVALLNGFSYTAEFPYPAAASLMVALPPSKDQDRRLVFTAAVNSYRLEDPVNGTPHLEDLGTLIVRFWRHLPPRLVLQAIDEVLDHAQKAEKREKPASLTVGTGLGEAQFSTEYQFRLFELLPIIQELDSARADSILAENPRLAGVLKTYPMGLQSLEPTIRDTPPDKGETTKFVLTHRRRDAVQGPNPSDVMREKADREATDIVSNWQQDPGEALKKARQLPDFGLETLGRSPRADALSRIAAMAFRKRPDISAEALKDLARVIADFPPIAQSQYMLIGAGVYLRMKDQANANDLVGKAFALGSKLYAIDSNPDKPNKAFKLDWPSAAVWRACVLLQDLIEPGVALDLLKQIKDPDIRASVQATLANTHLGVPIPVNLVRQQFGDDGPGLTSTLPIPH
jgi:hypothetical protein